MGKRSRPNIDAAIEVADDDLPDGAYWQSIADAAGTSVDDVISYVAYSPKHNPAMRRKPADTPCRHCGKKVRGADALKQHIAAKHPNQPSSP